MKKNLLSRRGCIGTKPSIITLTTRAGLVAPDDGHIYDEKNLEKNIANLLAKCGYAMCPIKATVKVRDWAKKKYRSAYSF
jgi:hypothetical protein